MKHFHKVVDKGHSKHVAIYRVTKDGSLQETGIKVHYGVGYSNSLTQAIGEAQALCKDLNARS